MSKEKMIHCSYLILNSAICLIDIISRWKVWQLLHLIWNSKCYFLQQMTQMVQQYFLYFPFFSHNLSIYLSLSLYIYISAIQKFFFLLFVSFLLFLFLFFFLHIHFIRFIISFLSSHKVKVGFSVILSTYRHIYVYVYSIKICMYVLLCTCMYIMMMMMMMMIVVLIITKANGTWRKYKTEIL